MTVNIERVRGLLIGITVVLLIVPSTLGDDWPQWRGPQRDGVWREDGIVDRLDGPEIKLRWRVPVGSGYSGPVVADGRVYVTDRIAEPEQVERVHCFDWKTGKTLWSHSYACEYKGFSFKAGPRASMIVHDGRAYALGAMGNLHCFDAVKGDVLWSKDMLTEYDVEMPNWGIAPAPLIEGDLLILHIGGRPNASVVALDRKTGKETWRAVGDRLNYSAPIVIDQAGKRVVVCWTGDHVAGIDAGNGKVYWQHPFPPSRWVDGVVTPVYHDGHLFISTFYDGSLLLKVHGDRLAVDKVWHRKGQNELRTDSLHSLMCTPILTSTHIYGVDSFGEVRCLDLLTGDRVWEDQRAVPRARWSNIHFVGNGEKVWMFNERGELLITKMSATRLEIISRAQLIEPTTEQLNRRGGVCWTHPAFAYRHVFVRNDKELVCASLAK